jgi:hypothetical protein
MLGVEIEVPGQTIRGHLVHHALPELERMSSDRALLDAFLDDEPRHACPSSRWTSSGPCCASSGRLIVSRGTWSEYYHLVRLSAGAGEAEWRGLWKW